jgi:hypothetical protein
LELRLEKFGTGFTGRVVLDFVERVSRSDG